MSRTTRPGWWRDGRMVVVMAALASPAIGQLVDLDRPEWARSFGGEPAFTEPKQSAVMGFDQPTSITEVNVLGGQKVTAGDLMVRGDDAEYVAAYETQVIQLREDLDVQRLEKISELRKVQHQLTLDSFNDGAASQLELDERRVTMEVADVELAVGKMEWEQSKLALDMYKARMDRLRLHAPFDGVIESVSVDVGASVGEEDPVLRIVNTDVLRMDVAADTEETFSLKPGDDAWILIDVPGDRHVYKGTITEVSPVAYYATRQRRVRVEMENPEGWPAGLAAWVRFTAPDGEWSDRVVDSGEPEAMPLVLSYADRTFLHDRFIFDDWQMKSREGRQ